MEKSAEENDEIFALVARLEKNEEIVHKLSPFFFTVDIDGFNCNMLIAGSVNGLLDVATLALAQHFPQFELLGTHVELVLRQLKPRIRYFYIVVFEKHMAFRSFSFLIYISQENDSNIMSSSIYKLLNNIYILYTSH